MNKLVLFSGILTLAVILSFSLDPVFAHPHIGQIMIDRHAHESQTQIIPINETMGIEKSTVLFHASQTNTLPWGFVEGTVANHVEGYPVIIQIFKNNDAVHFAQTSTDADGIYEYKFQATSSNNMHASKVFEGDYTVKIFKVVYLNQNALI